MWYAVRKDCGKVLAEGVTQEKCLNQLLESTDPDCFVLTQEAQTPCSACNGDGHFGPPDDRWGCSVCDETGYSYNRDAEDPKNYGF